MKDRFKFRAWNLEKGIMHYNAEDTYDGISNNSIAHSNFSAVLEDNEYVVMQCTGIKDVKGNIIYEGDILKVINGSVCGMKVKGTVVVEWNGTGWNINNWEYDDTHSYEIIGNIYENKELLNGNKN